MLRRKYIVIDSSFLVSLLNKNDIFHKDATYLFRPITKKKTLLRVIIPTTVFYEGLFVLLKTDSDYQKAKSELISLMMIEEIINFTLTETAILKLAHHTQQLLSCKPDKLKTRAHDLMILSIAMDSESSCLLTADKGMKDYAQAYQPVWLFHENNDKARFEEFLNC